MNVKTLLLAGAVGAGSYFLFKTYSTTSSSSSSSTGTLPPVTPDPPDEPTDPESVPQTDKGLYPETGQNSIADPPNTTILPTSDDDPSVNNEPSDVATETFNTAVQQKQTQISDFVSLGKKYGYTYK